MARERLEQTVPEALSGTRSFAPQSGPGAHRADPERMGDPGSDPAERSERPIYLKDSPPTDGGTNTDQALGTAAGEYAVHGTTPVP
jgi:hypothetical protein